MSESKIAYIEASEYQILKMVSWKSSASSKRLEERSQLICMQLYECEGKQLLRQYGIPAPRGVVVSNKEVTFDGASFPLVVKPQVLVVGRGKAGGIRFADNIDELQRFVHELIGSNIEGVTIQRLLIEEKARITKELYLRIATDRNSADTLIMASTSGGVDIEEVNKSAFTAHVNPLLGLQHYVVRGLVSSLKLEKETADRLGELVRNMFRLYSEMDALLVEIHPLAVLDDGSLQALDSKVIIDDYCIARHPQLKGMGKPSTSFGERLAELGLNATELDGEIAIITSGAGCMMATLDQIVRYGGTARACVDLGGSPFNMDTFPKAIHGCLEAIRDLMPRSILLNAFLQLADSQGFAKAIISSMRNASREIPTVVRLKGRFDDQVGQILGESGLVSYTTSFTEACKMVVQKSRRAN